MDIDQRELTRAEEQIMQYLWSMEKAFVRDLIEEFPEPKPAYNTVSTFVRILERKGFVDHRAFGRAHQYYPLISKVEYTRMFGHRYIRDYFDGSLEQLIEFFKDDLPD